MSIMINGLEIPTCCWNCPIQVNPFCVANDIIDLEERTKRPDKCPLTKVPEDVQPIVRCKDCKHFHLDYFGEVNGANIIVAHEICDLWAGGCRTTQNAFCSNGVRKDGET